MLKAKSKSVLRVPKYYTVRQNNVAGKVIFNQRFYAQIWHRYLQYLDLEYIAMFVSIRKVNMLHALLLSFSTKTTSILHICGGGGTEGGEGGNFTKFVKSMWSKYFQKPIFWYSILGTITELLWKETFIWKCLELKL